MTLTYDLDIKDWLALQKNFLKNAKIVKRLKLFVSLIFPIIAAVSLYNKSKNGIDPVLFSIVGLIAVAWFIFIPKLMTMRMIYKIKKQLNNKENKGVLGQQNLTINDTGIIFKKDGAQNIMDWKAIASLVDEKAYYFLYNSSMSGIVIPKDKVGGNISELDKILKKNINY
jgi:hypothetical protein